MKRSSPQGDDSQVSLDFSHWLIGPEKSTFEKKLPSNLEKHWFEQSLRQQAAKKPDATINFGNKASRARAVETAKRKRYLWIIGGLVLAIIAVVVIWQVSEHVSEEEVPSS